MLVIIILLLIFYLIMVNIYMFDKYFYRMTEYDLKAYGVNSTFDFMYKYYMNVSNFTNSEIYQIKENDKKALELIKQYMKTCDKEEFDFLNYDIDIKFKKQTWIKDPHTLQNYIFADEVIDVETIIHERIHILQRYNKKYNNLMKHYGFKKTNKKYPLQRNNPDALTENYSYNGVYFYFKYDDDTKDYNLGDTVIFGNNDGKIKIIDSVNECISYYLTDKILNIAS
jgi:hypothetical protein